jgi:drug/metabolite transporter (DMT)-like permease
MTVGADGLVIPLDGLIAILAASFTIAQSVILGKHVSGNHPVITNAVGMSIGAPLLLVFSLIVGETWVVPSQAETIAAVSYLVLLGSVGLFILTLLVVRRWTASAMSYAFVLFPVVTMLAEAWILDEPLTMRSVIGAIAVMTGVWFGALSRTDSKPATEAPAPARA